MIQATLQNTYLDDSDQGFDDFLGIGKKAKARRKDRRARKKNKRALRSRRKALKVERRQLKNDQRRAQTESIRSNNKLNETITSSASSSQAAPSKSPFTKASATESAQSPEPGSNNIDTPKDYTIEMVAAGLVILIIAGAIIYKNKLKQS